MTEDVTTLDFRAASSPGWQLAGLLAESSAALLLLGHKPVPALLSHLLAALALGVAAAAGSLVQRRAALLVVFALVLSLPVVGSIGVCAVVLPAWRARRPELHDGVLELGMPDYVSAELASVAPLAEAPIEVTLRRNGSSRSRIEAVMSLRRMEAQRAVPLLRVALGDAHEDVRLLSYAILERREKELRGRIELALHELEPAGITAATATRPRAAILKALAELHWELVHAGFASGEQQTATLHTATRYGHAALLAQPDGSLALLLGRMRLRSGDPTGALKYLRAAAALGIASGALAPLYAEAAFLMRRFDVIARLLHHSGDAQATRPGLDAVVRFWANRDLS
jgi:hypothetical protein